ncbi:MAG: type II toxin-antitoxin system prevent-host-death family antitoxin [Mesorhizobium sp.]|uniref:type II toxin-antitoxin system prevent-host-death family antitoxin n=1 Tax=unclassified Mesorhizobium TaxID=325217 RepID=UPI000FCA5AC9|nr:MULTISPECIES: type II toxin-antitoxin system prevent-host-death family antitoxin [unclassified Mesorhizobium]TIU33752.1 MAG: type II toxin-antitoxin system prevent-host-death family antitoxin [Mesorhizobium sp.]RUW18532.1 type II toxin-antitoxin system prevent-host-death family antitoxin [Mesorhizobium sp. M1E.F.Ca.ET.041.01.1.1]RUW77223.1 type II toxin-antitoxin system prevent-host-death family antitoxin [Mesorhizobium sp. M4B.F.Ca.ET.049.02.1.2]TIU85019.1 MAG: type II toxin-antitoxin syste
MGKSPGKKRGPKPADTELNSWPVVEAQERFAELLDAAANRGPQTIVDHNRSFKLTLTRSRWSPEAKELLLSGGRVGAAGKSGKE